VSLFSDGGSNPPASTIRKNKSTLEVLFIFASGEPGSDSQVRADGGGEGRAERSEGRPLGIRPLNKRAKRAKEREDSDYPPP